jgi:UDP-N-acetylmuramate dehydrogenase
LGEAVRADVKAKFDVQLDWEIKRIGRPALAPASLDPSAA